jgi:2-aminoethylphosphonate dioxygenase
MTTGAAAIGKLDEARVAQYRAEGFIIVRGVFSAAEVAALDAEANRVFGLNDLKDTNNIRCRWSDDVETKECRFDCFDPVSDLSSAIGSLARDARMIGLVSDLYGEPAHLFKDKLIYKPPNAKGYNLHQDYISWPSFPKTFVTAIVAIDPSSAENGATEVFSGYHLKGCLTPIDGNYHQLADDAVDASTGVMLDLAPGDVAVFSGFTPHRSGPNRSPNWRRLLYLSYNAESDGGDRHAAHYQEYHGWLKDKYAEYGRTNTYFR